MATLVMYNILLRFHARNKNIQLKIKNQILKRLSSKVSKNILYKNLITYILHIKFLLRKRCIGKPKLCNIFLKCWIFLLISLFFWHWIFASSSFFFLSEEKRKKDNSCKNSAKKKQAYFYVCIRGKRRKKQAMFCHRKYKYNFLYNIVRKILQILNVYFRKYNLNISPAFCGQKV